MVSISSTHRIPVCALAGQMALSYDSLMRWKRRIRNGQDPVGTPGPKKVEPLDLTGLQEDIKQLKHARKRTHATGALYQQYRAQVSRRQLNAMVIEARREYHRQEQTGCSVLRGIIRTWPGPLTAANRIRTRLSFILPVQYAKK